MLLEVVAEVTAPGAASEARFLCEAACSASVHQARQLVVQLHNLRRKLLAALLRAVYGNAARIDGRANVQKLLGAGAADGSSTVEVAYASDAALNADSASADAVASSNGQGNSQNAGVKRPREEAASAASAVVTASGSWSASHAEAVAAAAALLSPQSVRRKAVCTTARLREALRLLCEHHGEASKVADASGGEPPNSAAESPLEGFDAGAAPPLLPEEQAQLHFAGRVLDTDKPLSTYMGTNEKSKVLIRLRTDSAKPSTGCGTEVCLGSGFIDEVLAAAAARQRDASSAAPTPVAAAADTGTGTGGSSCEAASAPPAAERVGSSGLRPDAVGDSVRHSVGEEVSLSNFFRSSRSSGGKRATLSEDHAQDGAGEEEDETMLSESQAQRLRDSALVRLALRNDRLRELVRHIDGSTTRGLALRRLEDALVDDEFHQFTQDLLVEIGHKERTNEAH